MPVVFVDSGRVKLHLKLLNTVCSNYSNWWQILQHKKKLPDTEKSSDPYFNCFPPALRVNTLALSQGLRMGRFLTYCFSSKPTREQYQSDDTCMLSWIHNYQRMRWENLRWDSFLFFNCKRVIFLSEKREKYICTFTDIHLTEDRSLSFSYQTPEVRQGSPLAESLWDVDATTAVTADNGPSELCTRSNLSGPFLETDLKKHEGIQFLQESEEKSQHQEKRKHIQSSHCAP